MKNTIEWNQFRFAWPYIVKVSLAECLSGDDKRVLPPCRSKNTFVHHALLARNETRYNNCLRSAVMYDLQAAIKSHVQGYLMHHKPEEPRCHVLIHVGIHGCRKLPS